MRRTILGVVSLFVLFLAAMPAFGQAASSATAPNSQAPTAPVTSPRIDHPGVPREANPPEIVCFGYYPRWSVQLTNGAGRYVGYNEPDRYFNGDFFWIADENSWEWRRGNGSPAEGNYGLSATIEKTACKDPVQKTTNPYSASVYLPEGTMVTGCCRKLKPGEAVIGRHGVPTSAAAPNLPAPATHPASAPTSNNTPAGHPVDQY